MNKIPFFGLFMLVFCAACNNTDSQYEQQASSTNIPEQITKPVLKEEGTKTDTIYLGVNDYKEKTETPSNKGSQIPTIIQSVYKKAEKAMKEVIVTKEDNERSIAEKPTYFYDESPIGKYFTQNVKKSEVIMLNPSILETVSIKGKEGTVVSFPPASLVDENGNPVTSLVKIELKECYEMKDMLSSNLSTMCGDLLLQTGGMVYINATSEGKAVHLLPTHPIVIEMPTKDKKDDMELFYGDKQLASGVMNWRVANVNKKRKGMKMGQELAGSEVKNDWLKIGDATKLFDIGEIALVCNLQDKTSIDGKPVVTFEVKDLNPKLLKYKDIIANTLNHIAWEDDDKARASGKALHHDRQECLLGGVIFAQLSDLLAIRDEIAKYKNFHFSKTIPLQAHLNKGLYYKKSGLMTTYVFDKAAFAADTKFFEANFTRIRGEKEETYQSIIEELEANKESLLNAYNAQYATSYLFTTNQLGWINCDRFDPMPSERTELMVKYENKLDTDVKLIIPEYRSLIPGRDMGKRVAFGNLPKGKKAIIFSTKMMNEIPYFYFKEVIIGKDREIELKDYRQMSMGELEKEMIKYGIAS